MSVTGEELDKNGNIDNNERGLHSISKNLPTTDPRLSSIGPTDKGINSSNSSDIQKDHVQSGVTDPIHGHEIQLIDQCKDKELVKETIHFGAGVRTTDRRDSAPINWRKGYEAQGNTCRTTIIPEMQRKFMSYKVECIIKDVLEAKLRRVKYDPQTCGPLTQQLCALIKDKTKEFEFDRYKLVTQVLVGQDSDQSVQIATRCLWNQDTDNFAAATFRNESIFAVAIVYGLYLE